MLSNPDLDEGLSGHAKSASFTVEAINHPDGKIHIDPLMFLARAERLREIEVVVHVNFPIIEDYI